jgi:hypothetical protein
MFKEQITVGQENEQRKNIPDRENLMIQSSIIGRSITVQLE